MDSINEALIACVKACGGSKQVGPHLWPEKAADAAQRLLLDCLNEDRPQQLNPDQVMLVLRMAREKNFHQGFAVIAAALSYAPPVPIEPEDERATLQRQFVESTRELARLAERIERMGQPVRAVA